MKVPAHPHSVPFKTNLSLTNLIGYWQAKAVDKADMLSATAQRIVEELKEAPQLLQPIENLEVVDKHRALVDLIMTAVIPPGLVEDDMIMVVPPFRHEVVFATTSFKKMLDLSNPNFTTNITLDELAKKKAIFAYTYVLKTFYGIALPVDYEMIFTVVDKDTGMDRHLKTLVTPRYCQVKALGDIPKLAKDDLDDIIQNMYDIEVWQKHLPSELFEFEGFTIIRMLDVTGPYLLSSIKVDLLKKDSISSKDNFKKLEKNLQVLFSIPDLKLGLSSFQKRGEGVHNFGQQIHHSFLIDKKKGISCSVGFNEIHNHFNKDRRPHIIPDLTKDPEWSQFEDLVKKGIRNFVVAPLFYDDVLLGLLELGSSKPGSLHATEMNKIEEIVPLFAAAVQNNSEDMVNRIQGIIKEEYTAIHPSVEWRFTEAALNYIDLQERGKKPELEEIVFDEVIPLFGASDIRASSTTRNEAIKDDLITQLKLARTVFTRASKAQSLPIFDELNYQLERNLEKLKQGLFSGDETHIVDFLRMEIEPLMTTLEKKYPGLAKPMKSYRNAIDPVLGIVYQKRKEFEQSLTALNDLVSSYIDQEEEKAQSMFPHYFERYKTDGIEYNIYIGESIANKQAYHPVYLKNMRLWQLIITCEIARMTRELKPKLSVPLDMTHLILLHSTPLSIRFRMDEKQFDVDGAYNIRYEIVKKRIDKAFIKGTEERLTQPNKIAIVYSQDRDLREYHQHIDFLRSKGYIVGEVENLELEDLQGVKGLRALRVEVSSETLPDEMHQESLIDEIKQLTEISKN